MKTKVSGIARVLLVTVGFALLTGCVCWRQPQEDKKVAAAPEPAATKPATTKTEPGMVSASRAFPTCNRETSVIMLTKNSPAEVNAGAQFEYTIEVENLTDCEVARVTVTDRLSENMKMISADPEPASVNPQEIVWHLEGLPANATEEITVQASADEPGEISNCLTVTYNSKVCLTANVVEPALKMTKDAPEEVLICEEIPIQIRVTNTGTGTARNIRVSDNLPAGLKTVDGKQSVNSSPFSLEAGESKVLTLTAKADETGDFVNRAEATADGGLTANAETATVVRQPILTIEKDAREEQFVGRMIEYTIKVGNKGDAAAENLVVQDRIPAQTSFVKANGDGSFADGVITWKMASLDAGQAVSLKATVAADQVGKAVNQAMAKANCAETVSARASTTIKGIPAILLEVVDLKDPVEVGNQTTYQITATNQGSAPATNAQIIAELEDAQSYVDSSGATKGTASNRTITFEPLPVIRPGEQAAWEVTVTAEEAGDIRFEIKMTSDQLNRPVMETEATNQY